MRLSLTFVLLLALWTSPVFAQIEIRAPGQRTIPLAVVDFLPMGEKVPEISQELRDALVGDLDLSGLFTLTDPASFLSDAEKPGLASTDVDFGEWRMLGAEILIKGGYEVRGRDLVIEARLYDVLGRRLLAGRRYRGKTGDIRQMAHSFADQVLKSITGKAGPFHTRIAYISNQGGKNKELYIMDVDGHNPVRLTDHRSIVLNPDFSPVGKEVIFTSYQAGNPDLYRKEIYEGREARIAHFDGLNIAGRYRPDGREIVATLSHEGNPDLYLLGTDGSLHKKLTENWGIDVDPSWSPRGDEIVFVSDRQGNPHLFIIDVITGKVRRLTSEGRYNATPSWSPDGEWIAFARMEGNRLDIYLIRPDGTEERRLTFGPANSEHPRWSPDGRFLVYSSDREDGKAIFIMRADGTGARRISPKGEIAKHPAWSARW